MRISFWILFLCMGCQEETEAGACALLADFGDCPACDDGRVTCSYGEMRVTEYSCADCQATVGLLGQLCDSGSSDSATEIEEGLVCEPSEEE